MVKHVSVYQVWHRTKPNQSWAISAYTNRAEAVKLFDTFTGKKLQVLLLATSAEIFLKENIKNGDLELWEPPF